MTFDRHLGPMECAFGPCNIYRMKHIALDISGCTTKDGVYDLLLSALEAPGWHGRNLDALWDSITTDINGVTPPFVVEVSGHSALPPKIADLLPPIAALFHDARTQRGIDVAFKLGSAHATDPLEGPKRR